MSESKAALPPKTSSVNIDKKHFYRFKYLKSDHWQNLRLEKMVSVDAVCAKCGLRDLSNDVHHLNYRSLYDVTVDDLVVLCRKCHEDVHEYLDRVKSGFYDEPDAPNQWVDFLKLWNGNPGKFRGMGKHIKALKKSREAHYQMAEQVREKQLKGLAKLQNRWNAYCDALHNGTFREDYSI